MVEQEAKPTSLQIITYAPTEFFHCQHCEVAWKQVGLGDRFHAEQRNSGLLPPDLRTEYEAISDWVVDAAMRYGDRLSIQLVDTVSLEGVWKAIRYRLHRFPAFIVGGQTPIAGFDRERLDAELECCLGRVPSGAPGHGVTFK